MNAKEAVSQRVIELCNQKKVSINSIANKVGISPSTIYSMLNEKSKNPGIITIMYFCSGLGITLREFFNADIFDDIEEEYE